MHEAPTWAPTCRRGDPEPPGPTLAEWQPVLGEVTQVIRLKRIRFLSRPPLRTEEVSAYIDRHARLRHRPHAQLLLAVHQGSITLSAPPGQAAKLHMQKYAGIDGRRRAIGDAKARLLYLGVTQSERIYVLSRVIKISSVPLKSNHAFATSLEEESPLLPPWSEKNIRVICI